MTDHITGTTPDNGPYHTDEQVRTELSRATSDLAVTDTPALAAIVIAEALAAAVPDASPYERQTLIRAAVEHHLTGQVIAGILLRTGRRSAPWPSPPPPSTRHTARGGLYDLVAAGLLADQQVLYWHRPRRRRTDTVTVAAAGHLKTTDGLEHATPNAATQAIDPVPHKAWQIWRTEDGTSLARLRDQLTRSDRANPNKPRNTNQTETTSAPADR